MNQQAIRVLRICHRLFAAVVLFGGGMVGCLAPQQAAEPRPEAASVAAPAAPEVAELNPVRPEPPAPIARGGLAASRHAEPPKSEVIRFARGLEVDRTQREVRIAAQAALDEGWLEQAVCLAGTREHESLLAIEVVPRLVHAALLLVGLEPGRPGSWMLAEDGVTVRREPPAGDAVELLARFETADGSLQTVPLSTWVETSRGGSIPEHPWRFGGSRLEPAKDGSEIYAADFGGSVVGLVTFGDEVVAFEEVRSDRVEVEEAGFLVRRGAPPPPGTPVTLIVRVPRAP